jgi:putative photosynthetic complex assembly protein
MIAILGFTFDHLFLNERTHEVELPPAQVKTLKFEDRADGGVTVIDASNNQVIDVVQGEAGFVRGILRTIARERRIRGIGKDAPIRLIAYADGRLILQDTATKTNIELGSFGSCNPKRSDFSLKNVNWSVIVPVILIEPVIVWSPVNILEPVVAILTSAAPFPTTNVFLVVLNSN